MRKWMMAAAVLVGFLGPAIARTADTAGDTSLMVSRAVSFEEIMAREPKGANAGRSIFQAPTATLDELEMHLSTLPPGKSPHPPHRHADEEVVIIREGTVEVFLDGVTKRVGPGSVIFQASNKLHGLTNVGDVPAVYHVIKWNSPGMKPKATAD
jgi:quercetin dioxygenase-like cupin family protein